jgi:hypothetical protein
MEEIINAYKNFGEDRKETYLLGVHVDGRILLKCVLKKYGVRVWTGLNWLRIRSSGGFL